MTRTVYLVISMEVFVDTTHEDAFDESLDCIASELEYSVDFDENIELDDGSIVHAEIGDTEILGILGENPL